MDEEYNKKGYYLPLLRHGLRDDRSGAGGGG